MHLSKISLALRQWGAGAGFSPLDLFSSGEQGAWYDPSDLTTMFQDSAGTTPVTADGQPVGLILDKSKGLALGPELAPDWDLLGGGAGWYVDPEFTIANGVAVGVVSVKSGNKYLYPEIINTEIGKVYEATFVVTEVTGRFHIFVWDGTTDINFKLDIPDPGSYSLIFRANSTSGYYPYIDLLEPARVVVESISVKELAGNHASQATAASRPLYKTDGTYHWLQFDGVDDSLATVSFDLSLSTTASLFCGFDKTVDTNPGWMFENTTGNAAGISVAQRGTGIEIGFKTSTETNETVSPYPAQQKIVVSALLDPSNPVYQEKIGIRVNETPVEGSVWNTASGGNFGDFPLNIGKRSDGYYLAFHLNSLILRGALSTTQEITDTETWVAGKTGVTL